MAVNERIKQFIGPFDNNQEINIKQSDAYKIGFSVNEKDFMEWSNPNMNSPIMIKINNQKIQMGKTFIYQPGDFMENGLTISFPNGAPASMIVDIIYMS